MKKTALALVAWALPLVAVGADVVPISGVASQSNHDVSGQIRYSVWLGDRIKIALSESNECVGKIYMRERDIGAHGDIACEDGMMGNIEVRFGESKATGYGRIALGNKSDVYFVVGEKFTFDERMRALEAKYPVMAAAESGQVSQPPSGAAQPQPIAPPVSAQPAEPLYSGNGNFDGIIVDAYNLKASKVDSDVAECRRLRKQAESDPVSDAVAGAIVGSAFAKLAGREYSRTESAKRGAAVGLVDGAASSDKNKDAVFRNCLIGRGYKVLN